MQTIEFIRTVKWIQSTLPHEVTENLLGGGLRRTLHLSEKPDPASMSAVNRLTHELARVMPKLAAHAHARAVLQAFELEQLLAPAFPTQVSDAALTVVVGGKTEGFFKLLRPVEHRWNEMCACVKPLEGLLVPECVAEPEDFDEVLTIQVAEQKDPACLGSVSEILKSVETLYRAIARARGVEEKKIEPLRVVYVASGTDIRFDFQGLGDAIKEFGSPPKKLLT